MSGEGPEGSPSRRFDPVVQVSSRPGGGGVQIMSTTAPAPAPAPATAAAATPKAQPAALNRSSLTEMDPLSMLLQAEMSPPTPPPPPPQQQQQQQQQQPMSSAPIPAAPPIIPATFPSPPPPPPPPAAAAASPPVATPTVQTAAFPAVPHTTGASKSPRPSTASAFPDVIQTQRSSSGPILHVGTSTAAAGGPRSASRLASPAGGAKHHLHAYAASGPSSWPGPGSAAAASSASSGPAATTITSPGMSVGATTPTAAASAAPKAPVKSIDDHMADFLADTPVSPLDLTTVGGSRLEQLTTLARARAWSALASMTEAAHTRKFEDVHHYLAEVMLHASALAHMDQPAQASRFLSLLGSLDAPQYTTTDAAGTTLSVVPFSIRMMSAELLAQSDDGPPGTGGRPSADALMELEGTLNPLSPPNSVRAALSVEECVRWRCRIVGRACHALVKADLGLVAARLSARVIRGLKDDGGILGPHTGGIPPAESDEVRLKLYSSLGRAYLHIGNVTAADAAFKAAPSTVSSPSASVLKQLNRGELAFAMKDVRTAYSVFEAALAESRDLPVENPEDAALSTPLVVTTSNNLAIASLHCGKVQAGITLLESLIKEDPTRFLHTQIITNLCILYELGCDSATATRLKLILQRVAGKFHLTHIPSTVYRL